MTEPVATRVWRLLDITLLSQSVQDALHGRSALLKPPSKVTHPDRLIRFFKKIENRKATFQREIPCHQVFLISE
ncbi:hypothetical protein GCM10010869_24680 [Mesorhizobium tianshanense]|nr:hypothetical protein GCM10010869_24680 [Mesorhizobium tianshanense]